MKTRHSNLEKEFCEFQYETLYKIFRKLRRKIEVISENYNNYVFILFYDFTFGTGILLGSLGINLRLNVTTPS